MGSIIALLIIVLITLLVNRIATVALVLTGMSRDMARFQARSALSTVGFTTAESESVVNHPVRRQIVSTLMFFGNAGFVTVIATSMATFSGNSEYHIATRLGLLAAGLAGLWALAMSRWVEDKLNRVIMWALSRYAEMEVLDYVELLHLGSGAGFCVTEMKIEPGDWLIGKTLTDLRLSDAGVNVLGIQRTNQGEFVGAPTGHTYVRTGDKMIVYGARADIRALDSRKSDEEGHAAHLATSGERRTAHEAKAMQSEERQALRARGGTAEGRGAT